MIRPRVGALADAALGDRITSLARAAGFDIQPSQVDRLATYLRLLLRWNGVYNLTSVRTLDDMLVRHLADCLVVVGPLLKQLPFGRVLDVGSGGGLPGVVIAVLAPSLQVTCIDAVGKKSAFIRQVATELELTNLRSLHSRAEVIHDDFDLAVSRAFAPLADFVTMTRSALAPSGGWMAMKGVEPHEEIAVLPCDIDVFHVEHLDVPYLNERRCLVWMRRCSSVVEPSHRPALL